MNHSGSILLDIQQGSFFFLDNLDNRKLQNINYIFAQKMQKQEK